MELFSKYYIGTWISYVWFLSLELISLEIDWFCVCVFHGNLMDLFKIKVWSCSMKCIATWDSSNTHFVSMETWSSGLTEMHNLPWIIETLPTRGFLIYKLRTLLIPPSGVVEIKRDNPCKVLRRVNYTKYISNNDNHNKSTCLSIIFVFTFPSEFALLIVLPWVCVTSINNDEYNDKTIKSSKCHYLNPGNIPTSIFLG